MVFLIICVVEIIGRNSMHPPWRSSRRRGDRWFREHRDCAFPCQILRSKDHGRWDVSQNMHSGAASERLQEVRLSQRLEKPTLTEAQRRSKVAIGRQCSWLAHVSQEACCFKNATRIQLRGKVRRTRGLSVMLRWACWPAKSGKCLGWRVSMFSRTGSSDMPESSC
ncbi:hypothetical protein U1Q18_044816 [Sarracenia purpurea var. burkii]